jgi:hypothetical protein
MEETPLTLRFKEFLNTKYRGKLRTMTNELGIPHTQLYDKLKSGKVIIQDYMYDKIAEHHSDIDVNYIKTGEGSLKKYPKYKDNADFVKEPIGDYEQVSLLKTHLLRCKDEVIIIQKVVIQKTEDLVASKEEIIKRDAEIKKVLYEFNTHLQNSRAN